MDPAIAEELAAFVARRKEEGGAEAKGFFAQVGDRFRDGVVLAIDFERRLVVIREPSSVLKGFHDVVVELAVERSR